VEWQRHGLQNVSTSSKEIFFVAARNESRMDGVFYFGENKTAGNCSLIAQETVTWACFVHEL
jgi:hypothetical protein